MVFMTQMEKGRDKKGRYSDQKMLSLERAEQKYVRQVAAKLKAKHWHVAMAAPHHKVEVSIGQLVRLCEYIDSQSKRKKHDLE